MTTFDQRADMQRLIESLARMLLPDEHDEETDSIDLALNDAGHLYDFVEAARVILKARARQ